MPPPFVTMPGASKSIDMPMSANAPPQNPTRSITRDDVLRLGQTGRPQEFLPVAAQALAICPADDALRFLVAANLGRLGLVTAAVAHLNALSPNAQHEPDVLNLRKALSGLPFDQVTTAQVIGVCQRNINASGEKLGSLRAHFEIWRTRAAASSWQRGLDSTLYRRPDAEPWIPQSGDIRTNARAWAASLHPGGGQYAFDGVIEGLMPPWALIEAWAATRTPVNGHTPRLDIIVTDPLDALDALASADLSEPLTDPRVTLHLGHSAGEDFARALLGRVDYRLPKNVFVTPGLGARANPPIMVTLERAHAAQAAEHERLARECAALYAGKDAVCWRARFARAATEPLRVIVSTSRYSTFIQHSARDQARAWNNLGHEACVLMEPDAHSQFTSVAYLRAIAEHRPDLFTLINFPRSILGDGCPANLPFVCWLQDAMPHLFSDSVGASAGELDFWAGHLFPEMFDRFACRRDNALPLQVLGDARKFHTGEIDPALRKRFACEVACVTHHSETPEALFERLTSQLSNAAPNLRAACAPLKAAAEKAVARAGHEGAHAFLAHATQSVLRETLGAEPETRTSTLMLRSFVHPLADRMLRHQTLHWAADLCRARGWRMRLYGRGWESHPTLAAFAAGELSHGEELRAAYMSAAAHLHVSLTSIVHQRVLECALSGGLCLPRVHADVLSGCSTTAISELTKHPPDITQPGRVGYVVERHPAALHLAAIKARFGVPLPEPTLWIRSAKLAGMRANARLLSPDHDADRVLGDLREVGFATREDLDRVLTRCIADPAWRWQAAARARAIVRDSLTYDAAVPRLIDLVAVRDARAQEAA